MDQKTEDYLVVLPVEPLPLYTHFPQRASLPLHATLMHWFSLQERWYEPLLKQFLEGTALRTLEIELESERRDMFGSKKDVPCSVLAQNPRLHTLHGSLLDFLTGLRTNLGSSKWVGAGYIPHVSDANGKALAPGSIVRATSLALVLRKGGEKFVVATWELAGKRGAS